MIKTKIIETTEKYDKDGKLVERFTRETTGEENDVKINVDYDSISRAVVKYMISTRYCGFCP